MIKEKSLLLKNKFVIPQNKNWLNNENQFCFSTFKLNIFMRKLISTNYTAGAFNMATLLLRIVFGILMMGHGYSKLVHFNEKKATFMSFLGLGSTITLLLVIFAEFFCALFITLGLFTRLATIPIIVTMAYALIKIHHSDFMGEGQMAALYLGAYLVLLIIGPGKVSVDALSGK
jgi:putative oxidoreductase